MALARAVPRISSSPLSSKSRSFRAAALHSATTDPSSRAWTSPFAFLVHIREQPHLQEVEAVYNMIRAAKG